MCEYCRESVKVQLISVIPGNYRTDSQLVVLLAGKLMINL
jgi:hypothetical protein